MRNLAYLLLVGNLVGVQGLAGETQSTNVVPSVRKDFPAAAQGFKEGEKKEFEVYGKRYSISVLDVNVEKKEVSVRVNGKEGTYHSQADELTEQYLGGKVTRENYLGGAGFVVADVWDDGEKGRTTLLFPWSSNIYRPIPRLSIAF